MTGINKPSTNIIWKMEIWSWRNVHNFFGSNIGDTGLWRWMPILSPNMTIHTGLKSKCVYLFIVRIKCSASLKCVHLMLCILFQQSDIVLALNSQLPKRPVRKLYRYVSCWKDVV